MQTSTTQFFQHDYKRRRRNNNRRKSWTSTASSAILDDLLKISLDWRLPHGIVTKTSSKFYIEGRQATNIWKKGLQAHGSSQPVTLDSNRKGQSGRKGIDNYELKWKI